MKLIAFSLYGNLPKYCVGACKNIHLSKRWFPDYKCIFWVADDVPDDVVKYLDDYGAIIRRTSGIPSMGGMFHRFLTYDEPDCERFLCRDADSRINDREMTLVRIWEESGKPFHIVRDHPHHITEIPGSLWGCKRGALEFSMRSLIDKWSGTKEGYDADQQFLKRIIWPIVKDKALQHDSCTRHLWPEAAPIPVPITYDNPRFCGEVFDHLDRPRAYDWELMMMAANPPSQPRFLSNSGDGPLFIRPHLGLGDALILNGLVRAKAEIHSEITFPAKKQNMTTVTAMFSDLPNVKVVEVDNDQDATEMALKFKGEKLALGMFNPNWNGGAPGWDKLIYEQAGVPWEQRWEGFKYPTCLNREPLGVYALVHDDDLRKFIIPRTRLPNMSIIKVAQSATLFDYAQSISEATEIHCIDSCVAILADSIPTVAKKLALHLYARPGAKPPTFKKDWVLLSK